MFEQLSKIESVTAERERTPKRVFLEVGTNEIPVQFLGDVEFGPNDLYVGIDLHKQYARESRERAVDSAKYDPKNTLFMSADMSRLPISSGSVRELYAGNVFGDPSIDIDTKDALLKEAGRILAGDGGTITIKENNTPLAVEEMGKLLTDNGFKVDKYITPSSPEWKEEIVKYHKSEARRPWIYSYLIYAHKK